MPACFLLSGKEKIPKFNSLLVLNEGLKEVWPDNGGEKKQTNPFQLNTVNIVGEAGSGRENKASLVAVGLISNLQNIRAPHQSSPGTPLKSLAFGFISLGFFSLCTMQTWVMLTKTEAKAGVNPPALK